jgi:hypothetical protein
MTNQRWGSGADCFGASLPDGYSARGAKRSHNPVICHLVRASTRTTDCTVFFTAEGFWSNSNSAGQNMVRSFRLFGSIRWKNEQLESFPE